ncbi:MAG TPA: F0F1 ATP synthase subunit B, partial [Stellaceae bacterium]|nr:F0F1 ATP synthase subunit B [Stellaceae bacterium]
MMREILLDPEFWVLVAFVIAVGAALRKALPMVGRMLDERAAKIKNDLTDAEETREAAQARLAE